MNFRLSNLRFFLWFLRLLRDQPTQPHSATVQIGKEHIAFGQLRKAADELKTLYGFDQTVALEELIYRIERQIRQVEQRISGKKVPADAHVSSRLPHTDATRILEEIDELHKKLLAVNREALKQATVPRQRQTPLPPKPILATNHPPSLLTALVAHAHPMSVARRAVASIIDLPMLSRWKDRLLLMAFGDTHHPAIQPPVEQVDHANRRKNDIRRALSTAQRNQQSRLLRALSRWLLGPQQQKEILQTMASTMRDHQTPLTQTQLLRHLSNAIAWQLAHGKTPLYTLMHGQWIIAGQKSLPSLPSLGPKQIYLAPFSGLIRWFQNSFSIAQIFLRRHGPASILGGYVGAGGGSLVGGVLGAILGGALFSPLGPAGTVVGGALGGVAGGSVGFLVGPMVGGPIVRFVVRGWNAVWSPFGGAQLAASRGIQAAGRALSGAGRGLFSALKPSLSGFLSTRGAVLAASFALEMKLILVGLTVVLIGTLIAIVYLQWNISSILLPGSFISERGGATLQPSVTTPLTTVATAAIQYKGPYDTHPAVVVVNMIRNSPCKGVVTGSDAACIDWIRKNLSPTMANHIIGSAQTPGHNNLLQCVGFMKALAAEFNGKAPNNGGHAYMFADPNYLPTNYRFIRKTTSRIEDRIRAGDIAVWTRGRFGHIAYVVGIDGPTRFYAAEANNCKPDCGIVSVTSKTTNDQQLAGWLRVKP